MSHTYFLTVDWCNKGHRGIFCDNRGGPFSKVDEPHTTEEMDGILGLFWMVLSPASVLMTEAEVAKHNQWYPLEEYSNVYGYAVTEEGECHD